MAEMKEGLIRKVGRKIREMTEPPRSYDPGSNPERRSTVDQIRDRNMRMQYEHEKAVGGPNTDKSYEEWRSYYRD